MDQHTTYAIVTGASGGIGSGFARRLLDRGYTVYLQYRSEKALAEMQASFVGNQVRFFASDLTNKEQLENFFVDCKSKEIIFSVVVLAAGAWKPDAAFDTVPAAISSLSEINFETKQLFADCFCKAYKNQKSQTKLILISSHVSDLTTTEAQEYGLVGYVTSMKKVNALAEGLRKNYPEMLEVHLLKTKRVETKALQEVRKENPDVEIGQSADEYAETELLQAGI